MTGKPIRVVALLEAATVTGPAGNIIRFAKLGHAQGKVNMSIAAFHRFGETPADRHPLFKAVRAAGIELDIISEKHRFDRSVIPRLREIAERRGADIVETHAVKSHFLARYAGLQRRVRWIAFQHGYTSEDLKMRLYIRLDRWSLRAANRVVTDCVPFAKALESTGVRPDRIHVLASSIQPKPRPNENKVRDLRESLGILGGERVILSIGRLSSEKAHSDLLSAFRLLKADNPGMAARLILVGDGIERPALERTVASAGMTGQVILAGHQADVWPYYGLADLFVLPSLSEGSPNVLLEAMTAGVPIVATAVGGVPETVEATALLVPARDPRALATAIRRILEEPELAARLADQASARVLDHFSAQSYCDRLCGIYRIAMGTPLG